MAGLEGLYSRSSPRDPPPPPPVSVTGSGHEDKYVVLCLGLSGLVAEHVLSQPFVVVRRQCQVNIASHRAHLTPFSLVPVLIHLNRWQGIGVLWKGLGSSLTVKGNKEKLVH